MYKLFIIIILHLFSICYALPYDARCDDDVEIISIDNSGQALKEDEIEALTNKEISNIRKKGGGAYASNPDCTNTFIAVGTSLATVVGVLTSFVISLSVSTVPGLNIFTAGFAIGSAVALSLTIVQIIHSSGCTYAFVRDPVYRYDYNTVDDEGNNVQAGDYVVCKNPEGNSCPDGVYIKKNKEGDHRSAKHVAGSNWIEICHREPLESSGKFGKVDHLDSRENHYYKDLRDFKKALGGELSCKWAHPVQKSKVDIHIFRYEALYEDDKVCAYLWGLKDGGIPWFPRSRIGCHSRANTPPAPLCALSVPLEWEDAAKTVVKRWDNNKCYNCYVSGSCYNVSNTYAKAPMPITSVCVQCLQETVQNILTGNGCEGKEGFLIGIRAKLKRAVLAVLVLAVAIFGIKMLGAGVQAPHEYVSLVLKVGFITYFTIGSAMDYYHPELIKISRGLADLVLKAGGNPTVCNYSSDSYYAPKPKLAIKQSGGWTANDEKSLSDLLRSQQFDQVYNYAQDIKRSNAGVVRVDDAGNTISVGNTRSFWNGNKGTYTMHKNFIEKLDFEDYSYLAPWDKLDCKLMFYLSAGIDTSSHSPGFLGSLGLLGSTTFVAGPFAILIVIVLALFGAQLILFFLLIFYVIIIILVIIWAVELYIIAMIALTIIILVSPIFIPMMLFQVTKTFFDNWLKELVAYTLYPIMILTFCSLFISCFDKLYFGDLVFKEKIRYAAGSDSYSGKSTRTFVLDHSVNKCSDKEHATNLYCVLSTFGIQTKTFFGISFNATDESKSGDMWKDILLLAIIAFIFYNFFGLVGTICAEMTGSFRSDISRGSMSPDQMFAKGAGLAVSAISHAGGGGGKGGKETEQALEGSQGGQKQPGEGGEGGQQRGAPGEKGGEGQAPPSDVPTDVPS